LGSNVTRESNATIRQRYVQRLRECCRMLLADKEEDAAA
jgi:hypothetical protein